MGKDTEATASGVVAHSDQHCLRRLYVPVGDGMCAVCHRLEQRRPGLRMVVGRALFSTILFLAVQI